ncbi:MAG: HPP family protein [Ferroplasma sp.]
MEPKNPSSKLTKFVKSYILAGIAGIAGFYVSTYVGLYYSLAITETVIALLLVLFKAEHPPSMGIGAVFILERADIYALIFLFTGMILIIAFDLFLYKFVYAVEKDARKLRIK